MNRVKLLQEIEDEVSQLLSSLIRINTTNPPGNETAAAKFLAKNLEEDDFECELFESAPSRGSVVTELKGTGNRPSVLLLSHLDVVPANPKEWSVDPFGGLIRNGFVWGRGALDMKSMTAIQAVVMKLLKRNRIPLKGNTILAATADEEKGGDAGAGWLTRNHMDKVRTDYVITEGGGSALNFDGNNLYTIQTAEKGILWLKIRAKGTPGHGSVPGAADNAIMHMSKVIEKLGNLRSRITPVPTVRQYVSELARHDNESRRELTALLENPSTGDEVLDRLAVKNKTLAEEIRAMVRTTITPTIVHGGVKENVIPSECEAIFDCRVLPGQNPNETLGLIKDVLKDVGLDKLEFEVLQANDPSESSTQTPLYALTEQVLKEFDSSCSVAPTMLTGGTDSRFFRKAGIQCYGFQPMQPDMSHGEIAKGIHGVDERISQANLVFGTSVLYEIVRRFLS